MKESERSAQPREVWASGEAYEAYVGRWSRSVAGEFIHWLAVPPGARWLDVGCGTGALTQTILSQAAPQAVKGIDSAERFIDFTRGRVQDRRASFQVGDAQALPVESAVCDAVVSGLVLNFIPNPHQAVSEMVRVSRPGGTVALYVWDYAGRMQFMRYFWNAAAELNPSAAHLDEGRRFPLCNPDALAELFASAELGNVEVEPIDIWTVFKDFDDYWLPFLGGQGSAPGYLVTLSEADRAALRERIRASLPYAVDGSVPLMARVWAVRGVRDPGLIGQMGKPEYFPTR